MLFDPVISYNLKRTTASLDIRASRRGIRGPIHCYHCQRVIKGKVLWLKVKPFCSYCYGFRSALIPGMRDEMDDKKQKMLREKLMSEQDKMHKSE